MRRWALALSTATEGQGYWETGPAWLAQLRHDSGLDLWQADAAGGTPVERITRALQAAYARFLATPEADRVYAVDEAIRLARLEQGDWKGADRPRREAELMSLRLRTMQMFKSLARRSSSRCTRWQATSREYDRCSKSCACWRRTRRRGSSSRATPKRGST